MQGKGSGVSSNTTYMTVNGLAHVLGVTPQRVYQLIGSQEIPAPKVQVNERQQVYSLDEAIKIWKERGTAGGFLIEMPRVSSNQSR